MTDSSTPLVRATGLSRAFAGVQALQNAGFELRGGEVHALIGENGAGKSTLIKIIAGALTADSGTLEISGDLVTHNDPAMARRLGVAVIYQQPSLFPDLTVAENIGLALETGGLWRRIRWQARIERARELLKRAGSELDPSRPAGALSMPEQQIVEIAKAIGAEARILIMDEPTASLTDPEVDRLFDVIRSLRSHGVGIIYISHRLEEISAIADRVTVLRDGHTIGTHSMIAVTREHLIRMMVGRDLETVFPKRTVPVGDVLLEARGLGSREAGIHHVSFTVRQGEILGLAGLVGSGRTELARLLFGLVRADEGSILVRGVPVQLHSPKDAIRLGIACVPEDRRQHGLILPMPLTANTSLANLPSVARNGMLNAVQERKLTQFWVDRFRIRTPSVYTEAGMLSGGNQQKVAIARWMATNPQVVILDEPTQGVDVGSKSEIHGLMVDLAAQGRAVIMISSELPEILGMSDRIAVMKEGTIAGILERHDATQQSIMSLAH